MPCARACDAIAFGSPPLDLLTYQIHMPLPSKAVPLGGAEVPPPRCAGLRTKIGPTLFERRPRGILTYRRPEVALPGTCAIRRPRPAGRARTARAALTLPRWLGNITCILGAKRVPASF